MLVLTARVAFMAKDPTKLEDPLKYRVLTVLSVVCRKCASLRLKYIEQWVEDWEVEQLYTVKGGAQAAWWVTALEFEYLNNKGVSITVASADLMKAFCELQMELLYTLLWKSLFLYRVLRT